MFIEKNQQMDELERTKKKEELKLKISSIEITTMDTIDSETDENGKKKYSNQLKRDIEQKNRLGR